MKEAKEGFSLAAMPGDLDTPSYLGSSSRHDQSYKESLRTCELKKG